jgi:hypothetical protein
LYYAELINKSIHPNVENYLNYYCVKSIFDLDGVIKNDRFAVNTRIVKYILSAEQHSFKVFIQNHNSDFTNLLYNMALGNGYHTIDAYRVNLNELKSYIQMVNQTRNIML